MSATMNDFDIAICGAGPVGQVLALLLQKHGIAAQRIALFDAKTSDQAEQDARTVTITRPQNVSTARFYAEIENLAIQTDTPARVVIDERTGTIVIGQDVKIARSSSL